MFAAAYGGAGALLAASIPSYQFRAARDVYVGGTTGASTTSGITIAPYIMKERRGVLVSVPLRGGS